MSRHALGGMEFCKTQTIEKIEANSIGHVDNSFLLAKRETTLE